MTSPNGIVAPPHQRAWRSVGSQLLLWVVLLAFLSLDLWSKHWAFTRLGEPGQGRSLTVIENGLEFRTQYNRGAALGVMQGMGWVFVIVGLASVVAFYLLFAMTDRRRVVLHTGIALLLSGAIGNIYDRMVFPHDGVRDFIHFTLEVGGRAIYPWIFNVADAALVVGFILLALSWLAHHRRQVRASAS